MHFNSFSRLRLTDYCAANYSYGRKCYHIVFSRSETLEVNYLSVSARSDARMLLYGERPPEMHSHYSRVRCSLSHAVRTIIALFWGHCRATQLNFVMQLRNTRMKTLKKLIMFVRFPREIHRSALSDLLNSISRLHWFFSLRPLCQ